MTWDDGRLWQMHGQMYGHMDGGMYGRMYGRGPGNGPGDGWYMGGWGMHDGVGGWLGPLLMAVLLVAVVALAVWVVVRASRGRAARPESGSGAAERILEERFARGEIDEEEYRSRRAALSSR